jgi:hypothetical protein
VPQCTFLLKCGKRRGDSQALEIEEIEEIEEIGVEKCPKSEKEMV